MAAITELISYPIKGCAGISMTEALLTEAGLAHDRSFMVISESGVFRSQRRDPRLATIQPAISADGEQLTLWAPGVDVYAKLAIRCAVTMVDQHSGAKAGPEPLRTLAAYRRASGGGVAFGTKFSVVRPGKLAVGDETNVGSWGESEL